MPKTKKVSEFVTKKELDSFGDSLLSKFMEVMAPVVKESKVEGLTLEAIKPATNNLIPDEWNALIDKILGKDFGREMKHYGHLHIIVPRQISNASDAHWLLNKCDLRTVILTNNEGTDALELKLRKIAVNLGLKKINN